MDYEKTKEKVEVALGYVKIVGALAIVLLMLTGGVHNTAKTLGKKH